MTAAASARNKAANEAARALLRLTAFGSDDAPPEFLCEIQERLFESLLPTIDLLRLAVAFEDYGG